MNRTKVFKALCIAWTVLWATVAMLLIVLWVRSYVQSDMIVKANRRVGQTVIGTSQGSIYLMRSDQPHTESDGWYFFQVNQPGFRSSKWFYLTRSTLGGMAVQLPTSVLAIMSSIVAGAPWLPFRRFSLRTLLVATTLVAVLLGLIAWLR